MTSLAFRSALLLAVSVNPWLLTRLLFPRRDLFQRLALAGFAGVTMNVAIGIALHYCGVPIAPPALASIQWSLFPILGLLTFLDRRLRPHQPSESQPGAPGAQTTPFSYKPYMMFFLFFVLLVFPYTHLAGVDGYKWQDLATNVRIEQNLPWVIHPISLLGFTPRSYPSAQPILLATVQVLGGLGVDGGFFVISAWFGAIALFSSLMLGRQLFPAGRSAVWFSALYVFSPVFLRFNHWATGRGLFVALLPFFVASLTRLPRLLSIPATVASALMLMLSHKAGLPSVAVLLLSLPLSATLPRGRNRWIPRTGVVLALAAAVLIAPGALLPGPAGRVVSLVHYSVILFGVLVPLAVLAMLLRDDILAVPARRRLFPALVICFPLLCEEQMYGALLALPFVTWAAVHGFELLCSFFPARRRDLSVVLVLLTAVSALTLIGRRSIVATPRSIYKAAQFLENRDPLGPFRVDAHGMPRRQIMAYVSGCPRFEVSLTKGSGFRLASLPVFREEPPAFLRACIAALREGVSLNGVEIDWYGKDPRVYSVVVDGEGNRPAGGELIYDVDGVQIYLETK